MPPKDSNVKATREADYRIGTDDTTRHPNTRLDIKLNDHRAVMSSASGPPSAVRR
jgi:hypothetical protein